MFITYYRIFTVIYLLIFTNEKKKQAWRRNVQVFRLLGPFSLL